MCRGRDWSEVSEADKGTGSGLCCDTTDLAFLAQAVTSLLIKRQGVKIRLSVCIGGYELEKNGHHCHNVSLQYKQSKTEKNEMEFPV